MVSATAWNSLREMSDAGDPLAWFMANRAALLGYVQVIASRELADDALQETWLAVHRSRERFRADADPGAWVRGIARNVAKQVLQKRGRHQLMPDDRLVDLFDQAEAEAAAEDPGPEAELLRRCLDRVDTRQRELIALRYADDRSLAEIAAATGRSSGAVQVALSRLRSALADCIAKARKASA